MTAAGVRAVLPQVEAARAFTSQERAAADAKDWFDCRPDEECVIDGPLRIWRRAVTDGLDLCGLTTSIN